MTNELRNFTGKIQELQKETETLNTVIEKMEHKDDIKTKALERSRKCNVKNIDRVRYWKSKHKDLKSDYRDILQLKNSYNIYCEELKKESLTRLKIIFHSWFFFALVAFSTFIYLTHT